MSYFNYKEKNLFVENVSVKALAQKYGTPIYIYSQSSMIENFNSYDKAIVSPHLVCFAIKANSNLAIIQTMARQGAGFDIVSKGELVKVLKSGGDPKKVVFSGVAKTEEEIEFALENGILCFNVESEPEMERINNVALRMNVKAPVSIRINPDVDAGTHPYISTGMKKNKFGVPIERAFELYKTAKNLSNIKIKGIDCHIGSQLTELKPFEDALDRVLILIDRLKNEGIILEHIDMGGGLGVVYEDSDTPPSAKEYMEMLERKIKPYNLKLIVEPGRSLIANTGIFVSQVQYIKKGEISNFAIVDAGMNDMIRPALYSAWMKISEVETKSIKSDVYDVVGPVCESSDFLGKGRTLAIEPMDYIAQFGAGAYGFSMSSTYNSRRRVAEVLVNNDKDFVIRNRDSYEDLYRNECLLPKE